MSTQPPLSPSENSAWRSPWAWSEAPIIADAPSPAVARAEGVFERSWYQGRGAYGGVVAALAMRAMQRLEPDRPPRTFTLHFTAPAVEGPGEVSARVMSVGRKVSHLSAEVRAQGQLAGFASATFALPRESMINAPASPPPQAPHFSEVPVLDSRLMPPSLTFTKNVDFRFCVGHLPYSKAPESVVGGWCDFKGEPPLDFPMLAALLDVWPPAIFVSLSGLKMAASVDLTYHFIADDLSQLKRPFLYRGEALSVTDGYVEERDELWDAEGRPIATARQLIAVG